MCIIVGSGNWGGMEGGDWKIYVVKGEEEAQKGERQSVEE